MNKGLFFFIAMLSALVLYLLVKTISLEDRLNKQQELVKVTNDQRLERLARKLDEKFQRIDDELNGKGDSRYSLEILSDRLRVIEQKLNAAAAVSQNNTP